MTETKTAPHAFSLARAREAQLISAMLSCRTLDEAAKQAGVSRKTLYHARQDAGFMARYRQALDEMLEAAVNQLRSNAVHATEVLRAIAADEKQHGNARVRASEVTLTMLLKATDTLDILRRLEALEKAVGEAGNAPA
jgi:protoporphyrinogen oxidase